MLLDDRPPALAQPRVIAHSLIRFARTIFVPFVITRAILMLVGLWAVSHLPAEPHPEWPALSSYVWLNIWSHWDGIWYLDIASNGYQLSAQGQSNVTFAPLLPMLMRGTGMLFGGGNDALLLAGVFWSNIALLIGLHYLWKIANETFDERVAHRAVLYALLNPATLFLSAVYPMSLFLAITAASLYHAQHRRWRWSIAIACLAPLARPDGVLIALPLAIELLQQNCWRILDQPTNCCSGRRLGGVAALQRRRAGGHYNKRPFALAAAKQAAILLPVLAAASLWPIYQWLMLGDPLAFIHAQTGWSESSILTLLNSPSRAQLFLSIFACFVGAVAMCWWKLRPIYAVYATVFLLVMISAGRYWSIIRFLTILFPAYITLALVGRNKFVHIAITTLSAIVAIFLMMRFALGHWVA